MDFNFEISANKRMRIFQFLLSEGRGEYFNEISNKGRKEHCVIHAGTRAVLWIIFFL